MIPNEASQAQRLLFLTFGREKALLYWAYLRRMLRRQQSSWRWLRILCEQDAGLHYQMLLIAAQEVCLLHWQHPEVDPLAPFVEGGSRSSLLVRAWGEACSWAYKMGDVGWPNNEPRTTSYEAWVDLLDEDEHPLVVEGEHDIQPTIVDGDDRKPALPISMAGLTDRQREVLAYSTLGLPWTEVSRFDGAHPTSLIHLFRRAVRRMIAANPHLVARFGLVPCPDHWSGSWCGTCRMFGWVREDGSTLNDWRPR